MNNFELDRRAKELAASNSGYNLARRFLMLEGEVNEKSTEISGLGERLKNACALIRDLKSELELTMPLDSAPPDPAAWAEAYEALGRTDEPSFPAPSAVPEVTETAKRRAGLFLDSLHSDGCNEVKTLRNLLAAAPAPEDPQ